MRLFSGSSGAGSAPRGKQPRSKKLAPAGSRVRPGVRRILGRLLHNGKIMALALAALAGWGLYDALTSARYQVRVVEASGGQALTSEDVATLAAVNDQPIWFIDSRAVAERVSQSPYVESADARLVLPDRLQVLIVERKPEVRWMHNGTAYAVTWDGLVVDHASTADPLAATGALSGTSAVTASVPLSGTEGSPPDAAPPAPESAGDPFVSTVTIVDTTPNRQLGIGDHVDPDALELARRVLLRAPLELPVPVTRIEWDAGLGVSLIVGEGRQAVLGRSDDLDRKMATLRFLLSDNTAFSYLDLRPTTPYYR